MAIQREREREREVTATHTHTHVHIAVPSVHGTAICRCVGYTTHTHTHTHTHTPSNGTAGTSDTLACPDAALHMSENPAGAAAATCDDTAVCPAVCPDPDAQRPTSNAPCLP